MSSDSTPPSRGSPFLSSEPLLPPHLNTISPGVRPAAAYPAKKLPGSGRSSRAGSRRESPRLGAIALSRTHSTDVDIESGAGSSTSTPHVNGGHDQIRRFETGTRTQGSRSRSRSTEFRHSTARAPAPDDDRLDDDHDAHGPDIPLLSAEDRITREEEDAVFLDAPMSARGTLMDGIANMANSILGAGIIGLPYAIKQAGFVTGITLLIVLAAVTDWTIRLVVVNAKLSGRDSYIDVMQHCFGRVGAHAVSFFQFAFAFGGMCAFNVIIGDTIPQVLRFVFPFLEESSWLSWLVNRNFIIVLCTIAVAFPLSLHRDIVKLSKSSSFALVSMGIIVFSVVFRSVGVDRSLRGDPTHAFSVVRPGVFEAIGVISFAFVCHHNTMFIYQSIDVPTLDRFNQVTHASTGMSLVCCLLLSVTGYLVFTDKTEGNILNNFAADDWVINIARFCFGANMSTTIPLENYVCREVVEDAFYTGRPFSQTRHVAVTSAIVFGAMCISLLTCDLGVVLEIAGGLSATALAFIFPAIAYYSLTKGAWTSRQKLPAVLCATFGTIVLLLSTGITIVKTLKGEVSHKVCV